jgi:hypothetical protein
MTQIVMMMLVRAGLPVLIVMGNMQKIMQDIIELPYSPQMVKMLKLKLRYLLAVIGPPLGWITSQMTNVTNQNLKV